LHSAFPSVSWVDFINFSDPIMLCPSTLLVAFIAWSQVATAAKTQQLCFTHRTSPSPKGAVQTKSLFKTLTFTKPLTIIITPGTTVTPAVQTYTSTITSFTTLYTTLPQQTDIFQTIVTEQTTTTSQLPLVTSTTSSTVTLTFSTILGTTTVPTPAGFTGVLGTLPGSVAKRQLSRNRRAPRVQCPSIPKKGTKPPTSYPDAVTCVGVVETIVYKTVTKGKFGPQISRVCCLLTTTQ
jgi:hypothetical protein